MRDPGLSLGAKDLKISLFQRTSPGALAALLSIAGCAVPMSARAQATNIDTAQPFYVTSGLGTTVNPVFQGGVLRVDQAGGVYASNFTLDGSGSNTIDPAGLAATFSGVFFDAVSGTPGSLTIGDSIGGGDITLSGDSTYSGATTISAGTLSLTGRIASSSGVNLTGATAVFDVSGLGSPTQINGLSGVAASRVRLGAKGLTVNQASATTFAGDISGAGASAFIKSGAGSLSLSGVNTYTNATIISGGVLALAGSGSISNSSSVAVDGVFDISATTAGASITSLSGGGVVALGARTLTLTNSADTFNGVIGGTGGVTVAGGAQTLTGANTYTGATTIGSGATLTLAGAGSIAGSSGVAVNGTFDISATDAGASINALSGSGGVTLGARTLTLTNASGSFSGDISGAGGLVLAGGTQTLAGANSSTGGTAVLGGTLALTGAGTLGAPSAMLAVSGGRLDLVGTRQTVSVLRLNGGVIDDSAGGGALEASTFDISSGAISAALGGRGAVTVSGPGATTLSGVNTYTGGTSVNNAHLAIKGDAALGGSRGGLALNNATLTILGDMNSERPIVIAPGGGAINTNGFTANLNGPITLDGDLSTGGAGKISFSSVAQGSGGLSIGEGLFANNGVISARSVTVGRNATLRGVGVINAPTTVSGTLAPGNSPGTLTFNAALTLQAGATSQFDIDGLETGAGAGNFSRVIVNGGPFTAAGALAPVLRGMTGSASNLYTPAIGRRFQVISAAAGIAPDSSFSAVIQPAGLPAGARFDAIYAPTALSLVVTPAAYADLGAAGIAQTPNEKAVGAMLDANRPAAGLRMSVDQAAIYYQLYGLAGEHIPDALNGLSPVIYADGLMAARLAWYGVAATIGDQLADRRGVTGSAGVTLWGEALHQSADNTPSRIGYETSVDGLVVGIDKAFEGGGLIGLAIGGGDAKTDTVRDGAAHGHMIHVAVYGGARSRHAFIDWQADYLHVDQDLTRPLGFAAGSVGSDDTLKGGGVQINAGVDLTVRQWLVEPIAGLSMLRLTSTAPDETAPAAVAERIGVQRNNSLQSFAGVRAARTVRLTPDMPLQVRGLIGWSHEMEDTGADVTARLVNLSGASAFTVSSAPAGRDALKLGASFNAQLTPKITFYGSYSAALARDQRSQHLTAGARVRW